MSITSENKPAALKDMEVLIAEVERNLEVLKSNYQSAVSNLDELRRCVETDDLTSLLRRNAFMSRLSNLLAQSRIQGKEVQVMMLDVDHFKKVNDEHGHQMGDLVLEKVSQLIRSYMRPQDIVGRYGGEEIIIAMQCSADNAKDIAERIRTAVETHRVFAPYGESASLTVTLSIGISSTHQFGYDPEILISRADQALYRAKDAGRNRVMIYSNTDTVEMVVEHAELQPAIPLSSPVSIKSSKRLVQGAVNSR